MVKKPAEPAAMSKWTKMVTPGQSWEKEDLADAHHWVKQIFGLLVGIVYGIIPMRGAVGIMSFVSMNMGFAYLYQLSFLKPKNYEFSTSAGVSEFATEGFMPSFATFLVAWTIVYSTLHN